MQERVKLSSSMVDASIGLLNAATISVVSLVMLLAMSAGVDFMTVGAAASAAEPEAGEAGDVGAGASGDLEPGTAGVVEFGAPGVEPAAPCDVELGTTGELEPGATCDVELGASVDLEPGAAGDVELVVDGRIVG